MRWLKLPKWSSSTAANVVMGWPTVRARVLIQNVVMGWPTVRARVLIQNVVMGWPTVRARVLIQNVVMGWPTVHARVLIQNVVMGWPTVRARVLIQELCFLHRLVSGVREGLGGRVLLSLSDDVEALGLVKECRELEGASGPHIMTTKKRKEKKE